MEIIRSRGFDRDIKRIGAGEADVDALMLELEKNPERGDVIKGLAGVRKLRFALLSRGIGKSGGARAIYLAVIRDERIFLLMAYAKNEQAELTAADRKAIKAVVALIVEKD